MSQPRIISLFAIALLVHSWFSGEAQENRRKTSQEIPMTLVNELSQMYDMAQLPAYRDNSVMRQVSSFDTTGGNDDGFSGKYSFIRRNPDSSLVLLDVNGSGVINRIWTPTPTEDTLDFYIDDTSRARLTIKFSDLFSGKVFPFVQPVCGNQLGGYFCYFPILFQKSCRIISRGKKIQFHQIQYRLFQSGTIVKPFSSYLTPDEKDAIEKISSLWNKRTRSVTDYISGPLKGPLTTAVNFILKPGETKTLFNLAEGGRITGIEFYRAGDQEPFYKNIDIKVNWDHETVPAVYCPLADFVGFAFGQPSMQSLLAGSLRDTDYFFFPMPFDNAATIQLIYRAANESKRSIPIQAKIFYTKSKRLVEKEGKFYTTWRSNVLKEGSGPHIFTSASGKGHYIGTVLQARGLQPGMTYFFEGDDSTAIDGSFRMHGTGSEDYFNGGWYALADRWDGRMSLPIHGALDYSLPFSRTGGYRFYLSDKIPFQKSFFHSIEHGPAGNNIPVSYTSLAIYYCNIPPSDFIKPTNELTRLVVPDTMMIYPQLMNFNVLGNIDFKTVGAYNTGGSSIIFTTSGSSQLRVPLDMVPTGRYKLYFDFARLPEGCDFSIWQRQSQLSEWISSNNPARERMEQLFLCTLDISDFTKSITIRLRATLEHKSLLLNRMILVKDVLAVSELK